MIERERLPDIGGLRGHLARFPEDLRDIRRLQQRLGLRADVVARILADFIPDEFGSRRPNEVDCH